MKAVWLGGITTAPSTTAVAYAYLTSDLEGTFNGTEANRNHVLTDDAQIVGLSVALVTAPGTGKSRTFTIRNAGGDTAATVTISDTNTQATWSGSATCAAGSVVGLSTTPTGTPAAPGLVRWIVTYKTAGNFFMTLTGFEGAPSDRNTRYIPLSGTSSTNGGGSSAPTLANGQTVMPIACTITKVGMVSASSLSSGFTLTVGKNGMTTTTDSVVVNNSTGPATTRSIATFGTPLSVSPGDLVTLREAAGGSTLWDRYAYTMTVVPTNDGEMFMSFVWNAAPSTSAVQYQGLNGIGVGAWTATESATQLLFPACVIRTLYISMVTPPGGTTPSRTFTLRQNGVSTTLVASQTGTFSPVPDTTHAVTVALADAIDIMHTPAGTPAATAGTAFAIGIYIVQDRVGVLAATMTPATAVLNGFQNDVGVLAATMTPATAALTGAQTDVGVIAATMIKAVALMTGAQIDVGVLTATMQKMTMAGVGTQTQVGVISAVMQAQVASITGSQSGTNIKAVMQDMAAALVGKQAQVGTIAATMTPATMAAYGAQQFFGHIAVTMQPLTIVLVGLAPAPVVATFPFTRLPTGRVVSPTQLVTLRTAQGVQLDQFIPDEQISLQWSREKRETSRCDLVVNLGAAATGTITPWLHWIDVWDDQGEQLLWTGPILKPVSSRTQTTITAMDISGLASRTRNPLTKNWDATDPALIADEFYTKLIAHHNLPARTLVRTDPLNTPITYKSVVDAQMDDQVISDLVDHGLYWTIVNGVVLLGPWDRTPFTSLGEEHFVGGDGVTITKDGTNTANDILLKSADSLSYAKVPMGGLALQGLVTVDNMFGVSNTDKATLQYANYVAKIHNLVTLPNAALHPDAPLTIDQLIPSARFAIDGYGTMYLMELDTVTVNSQEGHSSISITASQADDNLPELVQLVGQKTASLTA